MAINVTVTSAEPLDLSNPNAFLDITFTNTNAFDYAENSNIYYSALLTDSTPGTALTREVTFVVSQTAEGTIAANTTKTFTFENTTNLVPTITGSDGRIIYVAQ
ncbi:hypothetical protein [Metaclostridioides mangenotii]|uniref:hypothetical protein n=1 Tax=Metaclostridioides mangenotii TaxID=1540 RepID=UPI0026EFEB91|nr:hypothetical protein [Clostridioides mangenotii]